MNTDPLPVLDRLLAWSARRPLPALASYTTVTAVVVAVGVFRALAIGAIVPWLLFVPVTLMAGLLFGRGPGVYSSVLATLVAAVFIGSRTETLWLNAAQWTGSALFWLVGLGIALLGAELKDAFLRSPLLVSDREAAQATLHKVFEMAPVGLSFAAADGTSILINEEMRRMLGRDISPGGIERYLGAGAIHEDGEPYRLAEYPQVAAVLEGVDVDGVPFLIERPDRSRLRTEISSVPLRDAFGAVPGAVSVVVDVEDRELAFERQTTLIGELAHRMKNTMAMVQAIVHQSLREMSRMTGTAGFRRRQRDRPSRRETATGLVTWMPCRWRAVTPPDRLHGRRRRSDRPAWLFGQIRLGPLYLVARNTPMRCELDN